MSVIMDAALLTRLVLDIIQMYNDKGVEVDLDSLEEALANERARKERINKRLKGKVDV